MKKFLTVLLVIAVMFTFSFGSAFAMTTVTDPKDPDYQIGDFYYDGPAVKSGTQGGQGVTEYETADVTAALELTADALADEGIYAYLTTDPDGVYDATGKTWTTPPKYAATEIVSGTTKTSDTFHGARLKNVQDLVASTLETVKAAKTSYAIHTALAALDKKVYEEKSEDDLVADLKGTTGTTEFKIGDLVTADGGYILPGYGKVTVATAAEKHFYEGESTTTAKDGIIDGTITNTTYGPLLGWFFDNGYETYEQITSTAAARKFQDSLVKISTNADATIYNDNNKIAAATPKGDFTDEGYVLYQRAKGLKRAVALANVIDMDASYNAVKAYRDFEEANYEDDTYNPTDEYNDEGLLEAAVGYYGSVNFKKYNDIKKMSQAEVLAAKADVVALAEAIVAFEDKFDKDYDELDLFGKGTKKNGKAYAYDLTRELGYIEVAGDDALVDARLALNVALPENLKASDKTAFEAYQTAYTAYKAEFDKAIYDDVTGLDLSAETEAYFLAGKANFDANVKEEAKDTEIVQAYLNNATVKVTTKALGNSKIRVNARIDAQTFEKLLGAMGEGSTVSYKFYQKKAKATSFKGPKEKSRNYITYTKASLKKGTKYQFQCGVVIKDKDGKVVAEKSYKASTVGSRICR